MFFMFLHKFDTASKNEQWTQAIAKPIMLNIAEISIKKIIEASMFTIQMDLIPDLNSFEVAFHLFYTWPKHNSQ